jgi:L-lactate dehydrogenase complex protein LldG
MPDARGPEYSMSRGAFLARIREPLGRAAGQSVAPPPMVDPHLVRLAGPDDDLMAMFTQRAAVVGMQVERIATEALMQRLHALLQEHQVKRLATAVGTIPQALELNNLLRRRGYDVIDWRAFEGMDEQFDLDAGITDVHAALAETGTLVHCTDAGHGRGLSLLPPLHIAIVRASDILPDMLDYWQRVAGLLPRELPSSQVFITGPSKTADIEGILITGVHGPGKVIVLVIEDQ